LGGHHANCRQLLRRLALAIAADITAAEPARVLRLPGTLNYKYDPPRQVVLDPSNDMLEYAIEDFDELLPPEPEPARPAPVPFSPSRPRTNGRDDPMGRARLYARRLPPAIEGQHGDNDTFRAACKLFRGFDLSDEDAFIILNDEWNSRCQPPWSEAALREKIRNAARYGHEPIGEKLNASKPPPASNNN